MPCLSVSTRIAALVLLLPLTAVAAKKEPPPLQPVTAYLSKETHEKEHVTIAAEPFDTRDKANFFRVDYNGHSIVPIRVIIQNDSDNALDLNQVRIQLIAADGTKLPAATPEELNRRLFRFKDIKEKHIPGTGIAYRPTPVDKKILDDDKDFSFSQTSIPAHTSANGFLFYDIRDLDDPPLQHAELYLKMMHAKSADGKDTELFAFSVPFDAYVKEQQDKRAAERAAQRKKDAEEAEKNADAGEKDKK